MSRRFILNKNIRAKEVRVVDDQGENLGIMPTERALEIASEKGLDLVLISQEIDPPVAKIVSFDKFRYQQEKEEKKKHKKTQSLKHVQISPRAAEHDLQTQLSKLVKFLEKGDRVEIVMRLRGREKANKEWARQKMEEFLSKIDMEYKTVLPTRADGQGIRVQIIKK